MKSKTGCENPFKFNASATLETEAMNLAIINVFNCLCFGLKLKVVQFKAKSCSV